VVHWSRGPHVIGPVAYQGRVNHHKRLIPRWTSLFEEQGADPIPIPRREISMKSRGQRLVTAATTLAMSAIAFGAFQASAYAVPDNCWSNRVSSDSYEGGCRGGTGEWRMIINCDSGEPDTTTAWKKPGDSVRDNCWWGDARSVTFELRD
jgi:hypothetical protein